MTTPAQFVQSFAEKVSVPDTQIKAAIDLHTFVRDGLHTEVWVEGTFLSGSYKRHTAVRPLNDVDIFVVVDRSLSGASVDEVLNRLHTAVQRVYDGRNARIRKQDHSIGVSFHDTDITLDLIPARKNGDGYQIPDRSRRFFIQTFPEAVKVEADAAKRCLPEGELLTIIRIVKAWNNGNGTEAQGKPLKSFHIEVLAYRWATSREMSGTSLRHRLASFFGYLRAHFDDQSVLPPGGGAMMAMYLVPASGSTEEENRKRRERWARAERAVRLAAEASAAAVINDTRTVAAVNEWKKILR